MSDPVDSGGATVPHLVGSDFLSPDECSALLAWVLENEPRFRPARTDRGVNPAARDALHLRDLGPLADLVRQRALACVPDWIARLRVTPFAPSLVELELAAHNQGSHFTIHSDTYRSDQPTIGDRMLSAVYYFHRQPIGFSGGALRLHRLGASAGDPGIDVAPEHSRLVVFPSWWPHEVMRVSCESGAFADSRFSLNCWIHRARTR